VVGFAGICHFFAPHLFAIVFELIDFTIADAHRKFFAALREPLFDRSRDESNFSDTQTTNAMEQAIPQSWPRG
jgi:hypothetical protein